MWKDEMIACVLCVAGFVAGGCQSHDSAENHPVMTAQEMAPTQVNPDQIPSDVLRTMHLHLSHAEIISAKTMMWKGAIVYQLYVKTGNNVYIVKIRPDGNYLGMSMVGERP